MHVKNAPPTDVSEIVARAKQGDPEAFDLLVERFAPQVYAVSFRILGSREEAEDCVQEAFLRAFKALGKFRGEAAFSTWLYRVAVNVANDAARRNKNRPLSASELASANPGDDAPDLDRFADDSSDSTMNPELHVVGAERKEIILRAVRSLPEHQRNVIILYDVQGLSYDEIAQVLRTRVGTVKSRLNRARLALKDRLMAHMELLRD